MESGLKFFKIFLFITIFLNIILLGINYSVLSSAFPGLISDPGIMLLLASLIFFSFAEVFVLILSKRYPHHPISNTIEGFIFTFSIITFLLVFVDLFIMYVFIDIAIDLQKRSDDLSSTLLLVSVSFIIPIACAVYTAINSFRLLKIIRKNRLNLAQQIKNIGADNE
jgi:hypothetical protein